MKSTAIYRYIMDKYVSIEIFEEDFRTQTAANIMANCNVDEKQANHEAKIILEDALNIIYNGNKCQMTEGDKMDARDYLCDFLGVIQRNDTMWYELR